MIKWLPNDGIEVTLPDATQIFGADLALSYHSARLDLQGEPQREWLSSAAFSSCVDDQCE